MTTRALVLLGAPILLGGCGDLLKKPQIVQEPRVIAARAEVVGDPGRATPAPGESLRVRWRVVAPEVDPEVGFSFWLCAAEPSSDGRTRCAEAPFAEPRADVALPGEPMFEAPVPDLGDAHEIAVLGVLCAGGAPAAGSISVCASGRALDAQLRVLIQRDGFTNLNPSFAGAEVRFDDAIWPESTATDCAPDLVVVGTSTHHRVAVTPAPGDREPLSDGSRETLLVSHLSDTGELDRAESVIEGGAKEITVGWKSPATALAPGRVARFFLALRDLRGGVDFIERRVCVVP
jgi:hypothetical protein